MENMENMENKKSKEQTVTSAYYTPDITDLHVGYECEFVPHGRMVGEPDNAYKWDKITLTQDTTNVWSDKWSDLIKRFYIRTPYLTREQIEAEGWDFLDPDDGEMLMFKSKKKILGVSAGDDCYHRINYDTETHSLLVWGLYSNRYEYIYYDGICKSINEFRKIIKWLGL